MKLEIVLKNSCIALVLMCGVLFELSGCSDKEEKSHSNIVTNPQSIVLQTSPSSVVNADVEFDNEVGMPTLAKKNNCTACHAINKKIVGPAWKDVSKKYKGVAKFEYNGKQYPLLEGLVMKVSLGGSGHWGSMPMPPNDSKGVKQTEIRELVQFVLGLAK